jgi:hypothetical protein
VEQQHHDNVCVVLLLHIILGIMVVRVGASSRITTMFV